MMYVLAESICAEYDHSDKNPKYFYIDNQVRNREYQEHIRRRLRRSRSRRSRYNRYRMARNAHKCNCQLYCRIVGSLDNRFPWKGKNIRIGEEEFHIDEKFITRFSILFSSR